MFFGGSKLLSDRGEEVAIHVDDNFQEFLKKRKWPGNSKPRKRYSWKEEVIWRHHLQCDKIMFGFPQDSMDISRPLLKDERMPLQDSHDLWRKLI
jgi:hypothetical protein